MKLVWYTLTRATAGGYIRVRIGIKNGHTYDFLSLVRLPPLFFSRILPRGVKNTFTGDHIK